MPLPQSQGDTLSAEEIQEKERLATEKLLREAPALLAAVEFRDAAGEPETPRSFPLFEASEIQKGKLLGVGSFGIVYEIAAFHYNIPHEITAVGGTTVVSRLDVEEEEEDMDTLTTPDPDTTEHDTTDENLSRGSTSSTTTAEKVRPVRIPQDDRHYENVTTARMDMEGWIHRKNGTCRYCTKRLHHPDLSEVERTRGMVDLALEAQYLAHLWHPHVGM